MRFCGIALRSLDGSRPGYFRAIIHTAVFYLTVPTTGWLILLVALVTPGNRTLHDIAACVAMTEEP